MCLLRESPCRVWHPSVEDVVWFCGPQGHSSRCSFHCSCLPATSQNLKAWEPGIQWCKPQSEFKGPWTKEADVNPNLSAEDLYPSSDVKQRAISSFLCFFFSPYSDPQRIGWCILSLGRAMFSTQSIHPDDNLIWKHPKQTNPEIMFRQIPVHRTSQSKWHIRLTITANLQQMWSF